MWHFSIMVEFSTVAVDPLDQDRSFWCGILRNMAKISALHLATYGRKSALQMVMFKHNFILFKLSNYHPLAEVALVLWTLGDFV